MPYIVGHIISYFAEGIVLYQYASNLFMLKHRNSRRNILMLVALYLILFCFAICFRNRLFKIVAFFLVTLFYLIAQYQLSWFLCMFHSAIITAMMIISEIIVYVVQRQFLPNSLAIENTAYGMIPFSIFSKLLYFTAVLLVVKVCIRHPVSHPHDKHSVLLLIFVPAASVFIMLVYLKIIDGYALSAPTKNMIILASVLLLLANLLVFGIYQYIEGKNEKYTQLMLLIQREENQTEYYEMLNVQNENQRILIHDIKKHLQSIEALNEKHEHDKIRSYIKQLSISSDLQEALVICDHKLLNAILCRYSQECREKKIAFHTDIRNASLDFLADNDVTSLFCNLLDNAVEAAHGIPDSYIELSCSVRENSPFVVINIINSCKGNPFLENGNPYKVPMEHNLPIKKNNKSSHGYGLKSIQKTINHYKGDIQMYYNEDTNTFHTIIILKR